MLRSATILALVGTAAAAGTYPADAVACANLGHFMDCMMLPDEASCNANTNCQFVKDEEMGFEGCTTSDAVNVVTENALNNATAALESQIEICGAFTVEEDCVGACAWAVDTEESNAAPSCFPSASKAQSILIADGADPYTRGYVYDRATAAVCALADDKTSCEAIDGCVYEEEDWGGECTSSTEATVLMVNNKCQGSLSAKITTVINTQGAADAEEEGGTWTDLTIAQIYEAQGVVDESDATKLAAQAAAKAKVAETTTAAANEAKDAIPTDNLAEADKAKLDFLAAAAIAGQTVKKVVVTLDAADGDTACADSFEKMGLTSADGACTATAARRRNLLASYSTSVLLDPAKVDETAAAAAVTKIEADTTVTATATDENPVDEIEAIPDIDADAVATFKTSAATAAEANVAAEAYEAEEAEVAANSAASSVAAVSAIATAALAAAACVFA
jgi:limonene-1,2-epoxide hydrolase